MSMNIALVRFLTRLINDNYIELSTKQVAGFNMSIAHNFEQVIYHDAFNLEEEKSQEDLHNISQVLTVCEFVLNGQRQALGHLRNNKYGDLFKFEKDEAVSVVFRSLKLIYEEVGAVYYYQHGGDSGAQSKGKQLEKLFEQFVSDFEEKTKSFMNEHSRMLGIDPANSLPFLVWSDDLKNMLMLHLDLLKAEHRNAKSLSLVSHN